MGDRKIPLLKTNSRLKLLGLPFPEIGEELPGTKLRKIINWPSFEELQKNLKRGYSGGVRTTLGVPELETFATRTGLGLTGKEVTVGIWDTGIADTNASVFGSRLFPQPPASSEHRTAHATQIASIIGATSAEDGTVQGMAPEVTMKSFLVSNTSEPYTELLTADVQVSNHSYGSALGWDLTYTWDGGDGVYYPIDIWYGVYDLLYQDLIDAGKTLDDLENPNFGKYTLECALYDNALTSVNTLAVWAAGNDRGDSFQDYYIYGFQDAETGESMDGKYGGTSSYITYLDTYAGWYQVPASSFPPPPTDGAVDSGYDTMSDTSVQKNSLTVGAVARAATTATLGEMQFYTAFGPPDDGRIKPDIVAPGEAILAISAGGDEDTATIMSGTSAAAPLVAGIASLLYEFYYLLKGTFPRSETVKGILLNTARRETTGPTYAYGYGLVDAEAAGQFMYSYSQKQKVDLKEATYSSADPPSFRVIKMDETLPLKVILVWKDNSPDVVTDILAVDDRAPMLVNNLHLEVKTGLTTFYPWSLNPEDPTAAATATAKNTIDNVQQVITPVSVSKVYTVNLSHTYTAFNSSPFSQPFSLIVENGRWMDQTLNLLSDDAGVHLLFQRIAELENAEPTDSATVEALVSAVSELLKFKKSKR